MRLLIISDAWHPQVNGVVRTYEHLSEELKKKGHEIKVIGPHDFKLRIPMPGYSEIHLALWPAKHIKAALDEYAPEHIHIATEGPLGCTARRICIREDLDFTTSYHTHFPDYLQKRIGKFFPTLGRFVRKHAINWVRKFHAPSSMIMIATQSLEDDLKRWGFTAPMHRLSRGADLTLFQPGPKTLFKDLPGPIALYVGRVAIEKNIEDFLKMEWSGSKIIVGHGPSLEMLKKQYPNAHFVGKKTGEELAEHYRSADVFVFPSRTDTFGIVIVEALACGIPVAGYNVTGPKDIVDQPFLGGLHENDLAKSCALALENGTAEQRAEHVRTLYTWENVAAQYEKIL